jgi:diaminohydroxyphosphoribosylaminopyrimidine deaminase/5-amino-6-(5-phosphoribosylamino)uracil reductase
MTLALRLAARGRGTASPNPMVGALVVRSGRIVGRGFHRRPGLPHAEILALNQAGKRARGATLYVTLEPCCHLAKRTAPCVPAVIDSGVRRVVIAMNDPNPSVNGKGVAALRRAGLSITIGVGGREAEELNTAYRHWIATKRPYVTLKAGMTLDGQIATASGESRWITGLRSRRDAHALRSRVDAVLIGVGTVLADDPSLTARTGTRLGRLSPRQPLRVVADSRLRSASEARVFAGQAEAKTIVATTGAAPASKRRALEKKGIETVVLPAVQGRISLRALLKELGRRGITSLLVEGGSELNAAMLKVKLVDHVRLYIAPALLCGDNAKGMIGGTSPSRLAQAMKLRRVRTKTLEAISL